jgi:hypothetical protein
MDRDLLLDNIASTVKTAKAFTWVALAVELQRKWHARNRSPTLSNSCSPIDC